MSGFASESKKVFTVTLCHLIASYRKHVAQYKFPNVIFVTDFSVGYLRNSGAAGDAPVVGFWRTALPV